MNAIVQSQQNDQLPASAADNAFNLAYRRAKALSAASLVPESYRNNIPNTMIAMEMADRIGAGVMQVMQNLHIIQGRPSLSSSFLIATVNACGRFTPLRFEIQGNDPAKDDFRVRAFAEDKASRERCEGTWITWAMVKAEGWSKKTGSKWLTMPEQMFRYRAAAFWARVYAPEVSQGIHTTEEVQDVWGSATVVPSAPTDTGNLKALEADLRGEAAPLEAAAHRDDAPAIDPQALHDRIVAAADLDALNDAAADIGLVEDAEAKASLTALYAERGEALSE